MHYLSRLKDLPIFSFGKLVGVTGFAQALIQGVGFISGVMIIRLLPTREYALYTLANTMLGTMTVLSDGGITSGVMAQGGLVWKDKEKLGAVLVTGLALRRKFAIGTLVVSVPILIYLLHHAGATLVESLLITLALIPAFWAALSDSLLEAIPKLHQSITPLQKNQVNVSVVRLILSGLTLFLFPFTYIAILASGLPRIWGNFQLKKITFNLIDQHQKVDERVNKEIIKVVRRSLPGAIYFSFSGQITIWLISIVGTSTAIAQIGALSRVSSLLSFITAILGILIIPRFARLHPKRDVLFSFFLKVITVTSIFCLLILGITYYGSSYILLLLGEKYNGLNQELVLSMVSGCLGLISGLMFNLCSSRGWILNPIIIIGTNIVTVLIGAYEFNLGYLKEALYFNIFVAITPIVLTFLYCTFNIFQIKK